MLAILVMLAIEVIILSYAANHPYRLRGIAAVNMMLLALCAPRLHSIFGFVTSSGNVFYAAVSISQIAVLYHAGRDMALGTVKLVLMALFAFIMLSSAVSLSDVAPGNETFSNALYTVTHQDVGVVSATFLAFTLAQFSMILIWEGMLRYPVVIRAAAAFVGAQIVDGAIFFPLAFSLTDPRVLNMMFVGLGIKLVAGLAMSPYCMRYRETS